MQSKRTRNLMQIITYTVILILIIMNFNPIVDYLKGFLGLFSSFFVGIALAFILNNPCMAIERFINKKFNIKKQSVVRGISIVLTYLLFAIIIILLIRFIIPQLFESIRGLIGNLGMYFNNLQSLLNEITRFLEVDHIDLSELTTFISNYIDNIMASLSEVVTQVITITANIVSIVVELFLAIIFSIYFLSGKETLLKNAKKVFRTYLPAKAYDAGSYVYNIVIDVFNNFIVGQFLEAFILGALCFIGMIIFRFDYPLLISVIIGISALVPVVGAYAGGLISFMLLLLIDPTRALWFVVFLVILQQFEGNVIYPRVVGNKVGLPGIWVLLSITVGGGVGGPLGILLAVPVASVLYTLLRNDINRRNKAKSLNVNNKQ